MRTLTATDFFSNPGRSNQDVQNEPIEVKSHGRTIGYYLSPRAYQELIDLRAEAGAYHTIREHVIAQRDKIRDLALSHGAHGISLFGSVARGEDRADSDIDFVVDFPDGYSLLKHRVRLQTALQTLFGRTVDLIVASEMNKEMAPSILKDAIRL